MNTIWILIILLLLMLEIMTTDLIAICYAFGSLVALLLNMYTNYNGNFTLQFLICILIGTIVLLLFRKKGLAYLKKKAIIIDTDKLVGEEALVTKSILKDSYGSVKINKKTWTAYSDKKINIGTTVKVLEVNGVKLKVK